MTEAHSLRYNLLTEIVPFFEKQCSASGNQYNQSTDDVRGGGRRGGGSGNTSGSGGTYDFQKAEAMLIDRYFTNLPAIDLEQQGFVFAHEDIQVNEYWSE